MKQVVKRKDHREEFDIKKLYASIFAAVLTLRISREEAELIADKVSSEIDNKFEDRVDIASHELFEEVYARLSSINPDAAYIYKTHKDLC